LITYNIPNVSNYLNREKIGILVYIGRGPFATDLVVRSGLELSLVNPAVVCPFKI